MPTACPKTLMDLLEPVPHVDTKEQAAEVLGLIVRQWRRVRGGSNGTAEKEVRAAIAFLANGNPHHATGERIRALFNVAMPPDPKDAYDAGRGMGEYIKKAGLAPPIDAEAESRTLESELALLDALVGDVPAQAPPTAVAGNSLLRDAVTPPTIGPQPPWWRAPHSWK